MDANDVFVTQEMTPAATGQEMYALWRSCDGGATWNKLAAPGTNADYPPLFGNLAVVGARLVAEVGYVGEGAP